MSEDIEQSDEIKQLIETIDDNPDRLHVDITPSVLRLSELGLSAARAVLELLDAPDFWTRRRAQRVLEGVVMRHHGWVPGRGYPDPHEGQEQTQALLEANGNYQADAPQEARRDAIERWRRWLEEAEQNPNAQESRP